MAPARTRRHLADPLSCCSCRRLRSRRPIREEDIAQLTTMGFDRPQCELALAFARGSVEGALQILLNPEIMELFSAGQNLPLFFLKFALICRCFSAPF